MSVGERVKKSLEERRRADQFRQTRLSCPEGLPFVDLSSNDYLRLSRHPEVISGAVRAATEYGASATASPLVSGYLPCHRLLESDLETLSGFPVCLLWTSGYACNHAILSLLPEKSDLVLADRLIHNSMITGLMQSGARLKRFPHNDMEALEALLSEASRGQQVFVVTESVFSMDGDSPDLIRLAELRNRYGFFWVLDEAHAVGWYGHRGLGMAEELGLQKEVDVLVGTLGKALGSMGAFTLFNDPALRDYCVNFAGSFIYSTYLAPACAGAARAALHLSAQSSHERPVWRSRARELRAQLRASGFAVSGTDSPILPVVVGDEAAALSGAENLMKRGWKVGAIRPPTVPKGASRLRISLNSSLLENQLACLVKDLEQSLPRHL